MPRRKIHDASIEGRHFQVDWHTDSSGYIQLSTHGPYGPDLLNGDRVHLRLAGIRRLIKVLRKAKRQIERGEH